MNQKLKEQAIQNTVEEYIGKVHPQQVVNDAIKSFREEKINEKLPVERKAKETLIKLTKTKFAEEEDIRALLELLVSRNEEGYEINYVYIFDKQIA